MRTNIEIDDDLMEEAKACSGLPTKKAIVEEGLRLLIRRQAQRELLELGGKVEFDEAFLKERARLHDLG